MVEELIQDVSDTAFMIAAYRELETNRPDALFRDPLAGRLAGDQGRKIIATRKYSSIIAWTVAVRTVIIDQFIQSAIGQGVDTVLNLGAGLDTRPYRMTLPESLRWIEVDFPHVMEQKEKLLAGEKPLCRLERVKMDLADVPARQKLLSKVNSASQRILVLTEGVVPYLGVEDAAVLADDLRRMDKTHFWIIDYVSSQTMRYRKREEHKGRLGNAHFRFDPPDWFGFFAGHGWKPKEIRYYSEEAVKLKRPIPVPGFLKIWVKIRRWFSFGRQAASRHFGGYVLLEPN
jgi:methyltransferase (TIGR00027 family)